MLEEVRWAQRIYASHLELSALFALSNLDKRTSPVFYAIFIAQMGILDMELLQR